MPVHGGRNPPPPHRGVPESGLGEGLWHLGDMAKHVGERANRRWLTGGGRHLVQADGEVVVDYRGLAVELEMGEARFTFEPGMSPSTRSTNLMRKV